MVGLLRSDRPHRRYNPLAGDWVLVSPQRGSRPWQGQVERPAQESRPAYDPACYLCPGNRRAGDARNPDYRSTYVFENDFSALLPDTEPASSAPSPLLRGESAAGTCRVICFSPRHDLSLAEMSVPEILAVVGAWVEQADVLGRDYRWVQIFENKGEVMGASSPHPHGQVWAGDALPNEPANEDCHQREYLAGFGRPLLLDYADLEERLGERVVSSCEDWLAVVPYWAVWPFETLLLPRRHVLRLPDLRESEQTSLAGILKRLLARYDNLFEVSFPYSMGWHAAPTGPDSHCGASGRSEHWQLHAHFYPPLLRSATVRKFMVGYEMLAEPQRDLTAEEAALRLRDLPETHYGERCTISC